MAKLKTTSEGVKHTVRVLMSLPTLTYFRGEAAKATTVPGFERRVQKVVDILRLELAINFQDYVSNNKVQVHYDKHTDKYWSQTLELTDAEYQPIKEAAVQQGEQETLLLTRFFKQLVHDRGKLEADWHADKQAELHVWLITNLTTVERNKLVATQRVINEFLTTMKQKPDHPIHKSPMVYWLGNTATAIQRVLEGKVPDER